MCEHTSRYLNVCAYLSLPLHALLASDIPSLPADMHPLVALPKRVRMPLSTSLYLSLPLSTSLYSYTHPLAFLYSGGSQAPALAAGVASPSRMASAGGHTDLSTKDHITEGRSSLCDALCALCHALCALCDVIFAFPLLYTYADM